MDKTLERCFIPFALGVLLSILAPACTGHDCTGELSNAYIISIVDGSSALSLCDATVVARDASGAESNALIRQGCGYTLSNEAGTYSIAVERAGFVSVVRQVRVESGNEPCGQPKTKTLTIAMEPEPAAQN